MSAAARNGLSPAKHGDFLRLRTDVAFLEGRLQEIDRDLEQRRRTLGRIIAGLETERNQTSAKLTQARESLDSLTA